MTSKLSELDSSFKVLMSFYQCVNTHGVFARYWLPIDLQVHGSGKKKPSRLLVFFFKRNIFWTTKTDNRAVKEIDTKIIPKQLIEIRNSKFPSFKELYWYA